MGYQEDFYAGKPTWYPEGWDVFEGSLGPQILNQVNKDFLFQNSPTNVGESGFDSGH